MRCVSSTSRKTGRAASGRTVDFSGPTDEQRELLAAIVGVYRSGCRAEFLVARSHTGAELAYPGRDSVPITATDSDFQHLAAEKLLDLERTPQGLLRGKPTAGGIRYASSFGPG